MITVPVMTGMPAMLEVCAFGLFAVPAVTVVRGVVGAVRVGSVLGGAGWVGVG